MNRRALLVYHSSRQVEWPDAILEGLHIERISLHSSLSETSLSEAVEQRQTILTLHFIHLLGFFLFPELIIRGPSCGHWFMLRERCNAACLCLPSCSCLILDLPLPSYDGLLLWPPAGKTTILRKALGGQPSAATLPAAGEMNAPAPSLKGASVLWCWDFQVFLVFWLLFILLFQTVQLRKLLT